MKKILVSFLMIFSFIFFTSCDQNAKKDKNQKNARPTMRELDMDYNKSSKDSMKDSMPEKKSICPSNECQKPEPKACTPKCPENDSCCPKDDCCKNDLKADSEMEDFKAMPLEDLKASLDADISDNIDFEN